jgi:DNA (cytosine-5)-methyltransferase 3A
MKNINVLSLFDGMSCGQQALERVGIKVNNYFASEIDKFAIQVTMANYPNTIQLGSVLDVDGYKLPKIDLLMGGSPCQSFSFAGKRKGMSTKCETEILTLEHYLQLKAEDYEFEGQSYLFWEYMRILNEVKPKYFLLENVEMGEKWERVLSKAIGVNGIHINSALVSAQNRKRIYWTNIGMQPMGLFGYPQSIIQQPKDKGILLKDILESEVDEKYFLSEKAISSIILNEDNLQKSNIDPLKSNPLQSPGHACGIYKGASYIVHNLMPRSGDPKKGGTGHLTRNDGKTYCLDTGNTNAVEIRKVVQISTNNKSNGGTQPYQQDRIYDINGISPALQAQLPKGSTMINTSRIRRLTPTECERLQTVADNYTAHVSDSQRYKMLGNGWTISVIAHIFSYIK